MTGLCAAGIFLSGRCSVALSLFEVALALTLSVAEVLQPLFTATLLRATSFAAIGKNFKFAHKIGFCFSERDFGLFNGLGHMSVYFLSWIPEAARLRFSLKKPTCKATDKSAVATRVRTRIFSPNRATI